MKESTKEKFNSSIDQISMKLTKFTRLRYVKVITNAFMSIAALSIAGSIFSLVKSFPVPAWQAFLTSSGLGSILSIPISVTSDLTAIFVVLAIASEVAKSFNEKPFAPALIALSSFMILTPFSGMAQVVTNEGETIIGTALNVIPIGSLGARGIFLAMLVGIVATRLYIYLVQKGITIKMPASVPPTVGQMFETMVPGGVTFIVFLLLRWLVSLTSFGTMQNLIYTIIQTPLMNASSNLGGAILYCIASKVLWLVGIHGGLVTYAAFGTIMKATGAANASAFAANEAVPYLEWGMVTGMTNVWALALAILMLVFAKSEQHKTLAKVSLPAALFCITEPLVFGFPIIMNPIMAVPFILSPVIDLLATSAVMRLGLVKMITGAQISTTLPTPIYMAFMNSSVSGFIWGVVLILINIVLFYPFFKIADRMAVKEEAGEQA